MLGRETLRKRVCELVSATVDDRCSRTKVPSGSGRGEAPFESGSAPGVVHLHFLGAKEGTEEVHDENELGGDGPDGSEGDQGADGSSGGSESGSLGFR